MDDIWLTPRQCRLIATKIFADIQTLIPGIQFNQLKLSQEHFDKDYRLIHNHVHETKQHELETRVWSIIELIKMRDLSSSFERILLNNIFDYISDINYLFDIHLSEQKVVNYIPIKMPYICCR